MQKKAVKPRPVPRAAFSWCGRWAGEQQEPEAGSSRCAQGRRSPGAGLLTPVRRQTVLQQSVTDLYLFYINAWNNRFQQISRVSGGSPCVTLL